MPAAFAPTSSVVHDLGRRLRRAIFSDYLVLILSLVYLAVMGPITEGMLTRASLANVLLTLLPLFVVAMGQTVVMITGGIDLSLGSIMALASVTGAMAMSGDQGWLAGSPLALPVGVLSMLGAGALVGLVNGTAVSRLRMPPFIVTLTTMSFFSGLAIWLTKSKTIYNLPTAFNALGGKLPILIVIALGAFAFMHLLLNRTLLGRWIYAVGHNSKTALISGVPVANVTLAAYVISGVLGGLAAVLYTGQSETGDPVLGQRLLLDIVGATVIGGTSLFGGKGRVLGTLYGVIFFKLLDVSLNLRGLDYFAIMIVKGSVILFAAFLDAMKNRLQMYS